MKITWGQVIVKITQMVFDREATIRRDQQRWTERLAERERIEKWRVEAQSRCDKINHDNGVKGY